MTEEVNHAREQAQAQLDSIRTLVAALDVDYDRLSELREDRTNHVHSIEGPPEMDTPAQWAIDNPDDAAELAALEATAGDCETQDDARQHIHEDPLSVQVRSTWTNVGDKMEASEFEILLCTGGPAVRIIGELDRYNEPARAWIEYQDWGTPWTEFFGDHDRDALLAYARTFYFG